MLTVHNTFTYLFEHVLLNLSFLCPPFQGSDTRLFDCWSLITIVGLHELNVPHAQNKGDLSIQETCQKYGISHVTLTEDVVEETAVIVV